MNLAPTLRGWVLVALTAASFGFAMCSPHLIPNLFSATLLAVLLSSFGMALASAQQLDLRRGPVGDGIMGRRMALPVFVRNCSRRWRQTLVVHEQCPFVPSGELAVPVPCLAPGEERLVSRESYISARGEYQLKRVVLRGGDPAGFFRHDRVFQLPQTILIYPERVPLVWLPLRLRGRVLASSTGRPIGVSGVGQEFFGIRQYRPTDSLRMIHWKASARQQRLMVREFEENSIHQVTIVLESDRRHILGTGEACNFELQIKAAASLVAYLASTYCNLRVITGDVEPASLAGPAQSVRQHAMYHLATMRPGSETLEAQLEAALPVIPPNSILYLLTLAEHADVPTLLTPLREHGVNIRQLCALGRRGVGGSESQRPLAADRVLLTPESDMAKALAYG